LVVLIVVAVLLWGANYFFTTYTIQQVYVEGNYHYTREEIQDMVIKDALDRNSFFLSRKYNNKVVDNIPFVDALTVEVLSPDTIKISVYEKALAGYVRYMDTNMYFDKDGYIVENSSVKTSGVPQIIGLKFDYAVLGQRLPVENTSVFADTLEIKNLLNKYELPTEKIRFKENGEITLYFGDVKVNLGNEKNRLEDKIMLLPVLLKELEGKSGTLQMETYDEDHGRYSFKPENL